ncbi:MAG: class I SAM-dependent methyltransferase [Alphaproteobacteria bacterium]|nr:class I SAM-dependent methyltransferase [Alphaproteobacteria bacterium]
MHNGVAASSYQFTADWFSGNIPAWEKLWRAMPGGPRRVLEIGSHEGRSAVWVVDNHLRAGDEFHAIDPWPAADIESRFDDNIALARAAKPGVAFVKHKGPSRHILPKLLAEGGAGTFDFIYVDGNHGGPEVLEDMVMCFRLAKIGGFIVCDDYLWNYGDNPTQTPKMAIDAFTNCFSAKIGFVLDMPLSQLYLVKKSD